ncbi:MAG: diacylglycerol kinase family lipid kinase [Oscillospiraceae bacterium]|nr:diacylglycerol kinase family lipid kinase [Oscillospiraceae bacterium]
MTPRLLLIINPNAGKMKAGSILLDLVSEFSARKYEVTVFPTKKKFDAREKVAKYGKNYDLIVCYGGDGTISEVVNGLSRLQRFPEQTEISELTELTESPPFSFIPSGTANDFASTVGMPNDVSLAVKKIVAGKNRAIDIGGFRGGQSASEKNFMYVAAFGLFTSVSYTVTQDMKKTFGHLSYVMEGLKQAIDIPSYRMKVEFDGKVIKDEFVVGLVTNSTSVAGMFKLDKSGVRLDDGKFELTLVKNPNNPLLLSQIIMDLSKQKYNPDYVTFEKVSNVKILCDRPVAWCLDGENGGLYKRAVINNLHKKVVLRI